MSDSPSQIAHRARLASRVLAALPTRSKNDLLLDLAAELLNQKVRILNSNAADLEAARSAGLSSSKLRRLELSESSIDQLARGLEQVAALPDPVGQVTHERKMPSGLLVRRVRVPLGVVCMIYEARPGVTVDAFALCLKSGNACILKGGREAARSNQTLAGIVQDALGRHALPLDAIASISTTGRDDLAELLKLEQDIDLVIPRGGEELIRFVSSNSRIPVIQHYKGVCHIFVDRSADIDRAIPLCLAAKTSAPATCNAAECVLVHKDIAPAFLPRLAAALDSAGVEIRADQRAGAWMPASKPASESDFGREFLDLVVAVRIVDGVEQAISHIASYGSRHTEAILSKDVATIELFRAGVAKVSNRTLSGSEPFEQKE